MKPMSSLSVRWPLLLIILMTFTMGGLVYALDAAPKIGTLKELIDQYDSSSCQECHEAIYKQWQTSHHAKSMMGLNNWIFMSKYLKKGPLSVERPDQATLANFSCAKCHLPQLLKTNDTVAKELAAAIWKKDKKTLERLNIGCLVCHQDKAVVHHKPDSRVLYGSRNLDEHEGAINQVRKSGFMSSPLFCGQCHGQGPNLEFTPPIQCATLYGSYLHGYLAGGGSQSCIDCHMAKADHTFPPNFNDRAGASARLKKALPMTVEILPYTFQPDHNALAPMLVVGVTIRSRAGHRIPDG